MPDYGTQIKELEDELKKTKYNKRTQHHVGLVKAKIARLRETQETRSSSKGKTTGYSVRKTGDGTAVLVGFPSVGKSTLLNRLTNAESKAAGYAFTTLDCIPGLLEYKDAKIQILDVPGLIRGAARGAGRGREVISVVRGSDLVLFVIDISDLKQLAALEKELYDSGIRLDQEFPDVKIVKSASGGIKIATTCKLTKLDKETIVAVMKEFKMSNAHIIIREDISVDQLIDVIEKNKVYLPSMLLLNKADLASASVRAAAKKKYPKAIILSAQKDNLRPVKDAIYRNLRLMRVFLKEQNKKADLKEPLIMREGSTIGDVCNKLHRDFLKRFRFGKVWGPSAKFPGQRFQAKHVLKDKDVLQVFLR